MENKKDMDYIIIIGAGSLGCHLANILSRDGKSVTIVDRNEDAFKKLNEDFSGFTLEREAVQFESLLDAKIQMAGVVVAATSDDNVNAMIAQISKKIFKTPKVICRLYEPKKQMAYTDLAIESICPNILSATMFKDFINNN